MEAQRRRWWGPLVVATAVFLGSAAVRWSSTLSSSSSPYALASFEATTKEEEEEGTTRSFGATTTKEAKTRSSRRRLFSESEYEAVHGRIGDGLYPFAVVEVHRATTLRLLREDGSSDEAATWRFEPEVEVLSPDKTSCQVRFVTVGTHAITAKTAGGEEHEFEVSARYVRRELRDLTPRDREAYFQALHTIYTTSQEEGQRKYGPDFRNANWFVETHLNGAATRDCDHWHDDAGFLNHHVGVTMLLEKSLQSVDKTVASAYWDYGVDAQSNESVADSMIFHGDWFGPANPANSDHVIDTGRWAFTPVAQVSNDDKAVSNAYGLLRSPWNTNAVPFVSRYNKVLGRLHASNVLPLCSEFQNLVADGQASLAEIFVQLNGELHGSVHIMLGGLWGFSEELARNSAAYGPWRSDQILLGSKFLWRQGYVDCPRSCTSEDDDECSCACGQRAAPYNGTEASALAFLEKTGVSDVLGHTMLSQARDALGGSWATLVDALCRVGHPGELFTSAAPQDPLFWPLHGLSERFLQLVRLWHRNGEFDLDETWGYDHARGVLSDTRLVCDWTDVDDRQLPRCDKAVCPGHRADDTLPFEWPVGENGQRFYTNREFYDLIAPWDPRPSYVYDRLASWPACPHGRLFPYDVPSDDGQAIGPLAASASSPKRQQRPPYSPM